MRKVEKTFAPRKFFGSIIFEIINIEIINIFGFQKYSKYRKIKIDHRKSRDMSLATTVSWSKLGELTRVKKSSRSAQKQKSCW